MKKSTLFFSLLICMLLVVSTAVKANDTNSNGNNGNHYGQQKHHNGSRAPIDGGISLLLAAGIGYGIKKVSGINRKKEIPS